MGLRSWLLQPLRAEIDALSDDLEKHKADELAMALEWRETRDKLLRYLKRIQEVESRGGGEDKGARAARDLVMQMKFQRGA